MEGRFDFARDENGDIFIDRDGELFRHILQFTRNASRPSRNVVAVHRYALLLECAYFGCEGLTQHLKENICPWDMRLVDRRIREAELVNSDDDDTPNTAALLLDLFAADHSQQERDDLQLHLLLTAAPRAKLAGDFQAFYQRLNAFTCGIVADLAQVPGAIVAGGAVIGCLMAEPSSDLDIFLTGTVTDSEARLMQIYEIVQRSLRLKCGSEGKLLVTRSSSAVTFHLCQHGSSVIPPVQVILGVGRSASDVLRRFDVLLYPNRGAYTHRKKRKYRQLKSGKCKKEAVARGAAGLNGRWTVVDRGGPR